MCHTSLSQHGNGNLATTTLAEVEVECADCHGTIEKYPWELPLGYQDEYGLAPYTYPRGTTTELLDFQNDFSTIYDVEDGYLLTARGNPFGNVVRRGNNVIVHSASGYDFKSPVLKNMAIENSWKNPDEAMASMAQVPIHIEKMECYSCHSSWAPQCYSCHVKIDYSKGSHIDDWIASGKVRNENGKTMESLGHNLEQQPGKLSESRTKVNLPNGNAAISIITSVGDVLDMVPHSDEEHAKLLNQDINWAASTRLIAPIIVVLIVSLVYDIFRQRKKLKQL